jgi:hypothetical protein
MRSKQELVDEIVRLRQANDKQAKQEVAKVQAVPGSDKQQASKE